MAFKFDQLGIITTNDIARFQEEIFAKCKADAVSKGNDYSGVGKDTFANIRLAYEMGLVETPAASAFVRGLDKVMRIKNLTDPKVSQMVKDESKIDTLGDLFNYFTYVIMLDEERNQLSKLSNEKDEQVSALSLDVS